MAHVGPDGSARPPGEPGVDPDRSRFPWRGPDRRGQMMVVMSLVLAVLFVAMALYLNTAIYAENRAAQQADLAGAGGATSYVEAVEVSVGGSIGYVNEYNNTGEGVDTDVDEYSDMHDELEADVRTWSNSAQHLETTWGRSANVSLQETTPGIRIVQNESQTFENDNAATPENWTVVETESVRAYEMNVTDVGPDEVAPDDVHTAEDAFSVDFDGTRHVYVHEYDGSINVTVTDSMGAVQASCGFSDKHPWVVVDVTGAELRGPDGVTESCPALHDEVLGVMAGSYEISHENASSVEGTYELVAEEPDAEADFYGPGDGSPYETDAIYSADVHVVYETPRTSFAAEIRVAPGEPDV